MHELLNILSLDLYDNVLDFQKVVLAVIVNMVEVNEAERDLLLQKFERESIEIRETLSQWALQYPHETGTSCILHTTAETSAVTTSYGSN